MFQLSFLNTTLLFFAAATVLPLLIWLLAKKRPPQIILSTIRFIKRTEKEQKSRTRIKNIILLIIRMLIILLVVLAAARPSAQIKGLKPAKKHAPTAIAILLDTSYSMDYVIDSKTVLDYAKLTLKEINKRVTNQDMTVIITSDENWNRMNAHLISGQIPEFLINSIKTSWLPISAEAMINYATTKLKESPLSNREMYYLTDRQSQKFPDKIEFPLVVLPLSIPEARNNVSCLSAEPILSLTNNRNTAAIKYELVNYGTSARNEVLVRLTVNGVRVAEKFVNLQPQSRFNDVINFRIEKSGWQSGYVEVIDEYLLADNRCYFAFPYELNPQIGVVTQSASLPPILKSMLNVYASETGTIKLISPSQVSLANLSSYSFLTIYQPGELTPALRQFISDWSKAGKGLLFCLSDNLDAGWKAYYQQVFDVQLKSYDTEEYHINNVNAYHPITTLLDKQQLKRSTISYFWDAEAKSKATVLLASDSKPLILNSENKVLWLFNISSLTNRFFWDAAFPVLAFRCFQYISNSRFESKALTVGQIVYADKIVTPDGSEINLKGNPYLITQPGVFALIQRDGSMQNIAALPDYKESEYQKITFPKQSKIQVWEGKWQDKLFLSRQGYELWKYCLGIAMLLLLLEMLIVKSEEWKTAREPI